MAGAFENLLGREFVIDEPRETVLDLEDDFADRRARIHPGSHGGKEGESDLFSQVAALLVDQERLRNLADELENRTSVPTQQEFRKFFKSFLTVLDSFDRVIQMAEESELTEDMQNWLKSVALIQSRMLEVLKRYGLRTMDPLGKTVDLDRHEVVEVHYTDSIPDETVVEVRQKGYIFDDKVLRDAQVVVAKNERR